jgi:hypothetical protein
VKHGLVFASGPTPEDPTEARTLGWEERELGRRMDQEPDGFSMYVHKSSVPELVAYARTAGRDCEVEPFAERQALLRVGPRTPHPLPREEK